MALRSSSPNSPGDAEQEPTLTTGVNKRLLPELPEKRIIAIVLALIVAASMFLPWWRSVYVMRDIDEVLNGWELLVVGLGIGEYPQITAAHAFGDFLFGALPTIPVLLLAGMLLVRGIWPRLIAAPAIVLWSMFSLLMLLWLVVLGWTQVEASFGEFPVMWGALLPVMVCAFAAVALWNWWRRGERGLWPSRGKLQLRGAAGEDAQDVTIDELMGDDSSAPGDTKGPNTL